jgi:hypothetical protein
MERIIRKSIQELQVVHAYAVIDGDKAAAARFEKQIAQLEAELSKVSNRTERSAETKR